ncbi:MAG: hypothetical protein ABW163_04680 [Luteimonas sp.]
MSRTCFSFSFSFSICLALLLAAPATAIGDEAPAPPFTSAAALERWLARNASPLDRMPPYARALFLDALGFGPRGLHTLPVGVLLAELTTAEAADVQRLLLDADTPFQGLTVNEAARLRAARAEGRLAPPSDAVLGAYRDWQDASMGPSPDGSAAAAIDRLIAREVASDRDAGEDLRLLQRAAVERATAVPDGARIDRAVALHARLQSQGLAMRNDHRDLQQALLRNGRIDQARSFTASLPDAGLPPVPIFDTAHPLADGAVGIWTIDTDDNAVPTLRLGAIDLGTRIVIVSSPGCGFSNAAAAAIPDDPELGPVFAQYATWLIAPTAVAEASTLRAWNRRHPATPIRIAADASQWPMDFDTTPQFLVFREGALVARLGRWQRDGSDRDALHAMLVRAGLLRSTGPSRSTGDNPGPDPRDR